MMFPVELSWLPKLENEILELRKLQLDLSGNKRQSYMQIDSVKSLKSYISKALGIQVYIKEIRPLADNSDSGSKKSSKEVDLFSVKRKSIPPVSTTLYCVSCELNLEKNDPSYMEHLIHLYCSQQFDERTPDTWLCLDLSCLVRKDISLDDVRSHCNVGLKSFALGNLVGLNTFAKHFDSYSPIPGSQKYKVSQIEAHFVHGGEKLKIQFVVGNSSVHPSKRNACTHRRFKLVFEYSSLHRMLICNESSKEFSVYLNFLESPLLFATVPDDDDCTCSTNSVSRCSSKHESWVRVTDLCDEFPPELRREFSMNYTIRMELKKCDYYALRLLDYINKPLTSCFSSMKIKELSSMAKSNPQISAINSKNYDCFYALKCLLTRSHEVIDQLVLRNEADAVNKFLAEKCNDSSMILSDALLNVYNSMNTGNVVLFAPAIKGMYEALKEQYSNEQKKSTKSQKNSTDNETTEFNKGGKIVSVKRAILMPTHVCFLPPQLSLYNRMLEDGNPDFFLRVTIKDANLQKINFSTKCGHSEVQRRHQADFFEKYIARQVMNGIRLGNRTYEYLGSSTSQLRSHSFWCYARDTEKRTAKDIKLKIGNLDEIQEVPKFMARMGLSFSQAMDWIKIPQIYTNIDKPEEDVMGNEVIYMSLVDVSKKSKSKKYLRGKVIENDGSSNVSAETEEEECEKDFYNFSDGIGRISQEIADEIYKKLKLEVERPCAFQIRYAGCKGMLVVDPKLKAKKIMFRESMKKYPSTHDSLNILKFSKQRLLFLNRPLITILEYKGVHDDVFHRLQKMMIHSLIRSMFYDEDAEKLLTAHSQLRLNFKELLMSGISFTEDPFFRSMILAIFRLQIHLLKSKAHIAFPENCARNMFGVLDETKTLKYGEVFVQYTLWSSTETKIIEGPIVVTKSPCMHPGDVRKFSAIDVPGLRHIKDCIVFPAKGPRPHPDEMAGSDLDGDEYAVMWLEDILFDDANSPAMHYAVKKKKKKSDERTHPIDVHDQIKHFQDYILNDNVGLFASSHLALADRFSLDNDKCKSLAQKHALALDFAKTGVSVFIHSLEMAHMYPDFMEKHNDKKTYVSNRILGKLFRTCKNLEIDLGETTDRFVPKLDPDLVYEGWEEFRSAARRVHHQYSKRMSSWLKLYSLQSEGEVLSGNFVRRSKLFSESEDLHNILEILEAETRWLMQALEKEFFHEFGGKRNISRETYSEKMFRKASAWYCVSYSEHVAGEFRCFGLPWLVADVLSAMKIRKNCSFCPYDNIFIKKATHVEEAVDRYVRSHLENFSPTEVSDLTSYKLCILDNANLILEKWLNLQRDVIYGEEQSMRRCLDQEFQSLSERLLSCSDDHLKRIIESGEEKKVVSVGYYVLETLIRISEMGVQQNIHATVSDTLTDLGRLAWTTLVNLACSCSLSHLGLREQTNSTSSSNVPQAKQNIIRTIQVPFKKNDEQLKMKILQHEDIIRQALLYRTKVKDMTMLWDSKNKNEILQIYAEGQLHALERLTDFLLRDAFPKFVMEKVKEKSED